MIKVLYVCHGNICRSPMAEFLTKDYLSKNGIKDIYVESCATSSEELENPVYPPAKRVLNSLNINCDGKTARKIRKEDYDNFDYIVGMDEENRCNLIYFFNGDKDKKISNVMDYTDTPRDVSDPWYTGDFNATLKDLQYAIPKFVNFIKSKKM